MSWEVRLNLEILDYFLYFFFKMIVIYDFFNDWFIIYDFFLRFFMIILRLFYDYFMIIV